MAQSRTVGLPLRVLEDRMVLADFSGDAVIDKNTGAFVGPWEALGVEPQDSNHSHTREVSSNTTTMTGGQQATSFTPGAISATVDGVAGSPVMRYIENPGMAVQEGTTYGKHTAEVAKARIAFIHKFTSGLVRIWVSREKANLTINDRVTATDPQARPVAIAFENGNDEFYYEERFYMVGADGAAVRVEEKVFVDVEDLAAQVEAGTAFYPEASGNDLKAMVVVDDPSGDVTLHEYKDPETGETATVAKTVALPSGVTGGTFTITADGHTTAAQDYNATGATIQEALRTAGATDVTVTGNAGGPYTINGATSVTADGASLTGGASTTVTVE